MVTDPRLTELSGMVAVDDGLWAMTDGGRRVEVHRLDESTCSITETRTADVDPYDAEDLARGPDGSLWVADTGDNERYRETVAVVVLPAEGRARLHRLTYPDGPHDAEALLVDAAGRPIIVTKEVGAVAGVYRAAEPPTGAGPTPLLRVGGVALPPSDTEGGPIGSLGSRTVTGAAASSDGRVLALRTYTDAWLYVVPDGDPVAALAGAPVRVPLPDEPQGEAIALAPDGTLFSGSEARGGRRGEVRAVPTALEVLPLVAPAAPEGSPPEPDPVATPAPAAEPTPSWLPAALGGGAVVGVLLIVAAALGLRRSSQRR